MAIASNLDFHVTSGYRFVMANCFSRGAYVARRVAGMLNKVGLLPAANAYQVRNAYRLFKNSDSEHNWKKCLAFKRTFCIDVDIQFLGVWDTVSSVGIINARRLPFTTSNSIVRTFRHAISLDERRARFQVKTWSTLQSHETKLDEIDQETQPMADTLSSSKVKGKGKEKTNWTGNNERQCLRTLEAKYHVRSQATDVKEVWFAGTHSDVGGGSVKNGIRPNLAHIPLRWMVREIFRTNAGIIFNSQALARLGMDPNSLYPAFQERREAIPISPSDPSDYIQMQPKEQKDYDPFAVLAQSESYTELLEETEEERDKRDALAPLYDSLQGSMGWWILECFPMPCENEDHGVEHLIWRPWNLGRGREIPSPGPDQKIKVHRSVRTRLEAQYASGQKYVPFARNFDTKNVQWVD